MAGRTPPNVADITDPSAGCPPVAVCTCWCSVVEQFAKTLLRVTHIPEFRRELKTFLFRQSYPAILLFSGNMYYLRHVKKSLM